MIQEHQHRLHNTVAKTLENNMNAFTNACM